MKYLMGIDNGGTFSKAAIFGEDGRQISVESVQTETLTPSPGYTERDMKELWRVNVKAIRGAIEKSGVSPADIAGVSFSGHGKGLYLVDENGNPAYNGILSQDARAWEYIVKWSGNGTKEKVFEKTFQTILACQPVSLLAWLRDNRPGAIGCARYVFMVNDYIRFKLSNAAYAEYTNFTGGNLVNLNTGAYDRELLALFGLEAIYDKLPPMKASAEISGYVTEEAAAQTGLKAGTPLAAGMFDVNACGIASGLSDEHEMCMIAGTWSINEYIAREPVRNGSVALNSMFCIPGYFLVEESSPTSAGNLEWFVNSLMTEEKELASRKGAGVYDAANRYVEAIGPEECNVVFLPFLFGSNADPLAKATWAGLTAFHDKRHMLRAVYEGVVFSHLTHVNKLLRNRTTPPVIKLSGGAANSDVWTQMFADALQLPVDVVADKEIGCLGAAMAAGIASGVYVGYKDAIGKTVQITKTVQPRKEFADIYREKYETYTQVAGALNGVWNRFRN